MAMMMMHCTQFFLPCLKKDDPAEKFSAYWDLKYGLNYLKHHQVLVFQRGGGNQKMLQQGFDTNAQQAKCIMTRVLYLTKIKRNRSMAGLYCDTTHNTWTWLFQKHTMSRMWKTKCNLAEDHTIGGFWDNLEKALLAPLASNPLLRTMLVLNPGLQEWIKCVILDSMSMVWQK